MADKGTDDLRARLAHLRGYPVERRDGTGSRDWVADANGAYIGFEDVMDALASVTPDADREGLTYADEADPDYIDYMTPDLADARGRLHRHRESVPGCVGCRNLDDLIAAAHSSSPDSPRERAGNELEEGK